MAEDRDCKNCIHRVPILDEENCVWRGADCECWDCEYINRKEALQAWKDRNGKCKNCEYQKFAEECADRIAEIMVAYGISSVEELQKIIQSYTRGEK